MHMHMPMCTCAHAHAHEALTQNRPQAQNPKLSRGSPSLKPQALNPQQLGEGGRGVRVDRS